MYEYVHPNENNNFWGIVYGLYQTKKFSLAKAADPRGKKIKKIHWANTPNEKVRKRYANSSRPIPRPAGLSIGFPLHYSGLTQYAGSLSCSAKGVRTTTVR